MHILDCSLRDGGQLLETFFNEESSPRLGTGNIKKIARGLADAGLDIIELGVINQTELCFYLEMPLRRFQTFC